MENLDSDLGGIANLMRRHIEIRNRSWMKRIHRDCFTGSDAVDFLVTQGFAESRKAAVEMGVKMNQKKILRNITDSRKFSDSLHLYRFAEDDNEKALLAQANAGNGTGVIMGHGGCKWSFSPHTAHNSYVLDISLAEEIERAVAGASVEARALAINKLRNRIREQAENDAPNWDMTQTTDVNGTMINIYQRKRPRGDFKNVKMTGVVGDSPIGFIKSIMNFDKRRQWESMFEDGVIVEGIDLGEKLSPLFLEEEKLSPKEKNKQPIPSTIAPQPLALPESVLKQQNPNIARATDDVYTFLQTVDLAGIPQGMAIAFLNDPERQHALAYLRKQMMLSNPQECMLCQTFFESPTDIRFCPCCAMVSCAGCVSKRVFEVVSRNVMSVCVHCYRESSRIFHPPQAVQDTTNIDESLRGKWWRPEELGMVDYSTQNSNKSRGARESVSGITSLYNDQDILVNTKGIVPLIPGLLDGIDTANTSSPAPIIKEDDNVSEGEEVDDDTVDLTEPLRPPEPPSTTMSQSTLPPQQPRMDSAVTAKTARCKSCGLLISRDIEAIEAHMEECLKLSSPAPAAAKAKSGGGFLRASLASVTDNKTYTIGPDNSSINIYHGNHKQFAGIVRKPDIANTHATRIIYRTARTQTSSVIYPREVCAFQDSFVDPDGSAYLYEISVRHSEVRGLPEYITADVMLLLHVARPIKGNKTASQISVISQIDTRSKGRHWLLSFTGAEEAKADIAGLRKEDLLRELKMCGDLPNLLSGQDDYSDESKVSLDDFELLAVLGRGGFGKVMQVRHKSTQAIFAMKILKKSELRRRKQVERTQTERTILANIQNHPFIVSLHYAFQNSQKLYMVMDFVQGGDFFTLMRKFRRLPEEWVRLYVLQVAMALQHLHDREIVYRDLKPENILLCADGYLKLTDFGLSRYFETRPPNPEDIIEQDNKVNVVTRSFCGTEQYMSPEMLLQQGHNYRMDWWCLGLLMHEMISGRHPFHGETHYETLRNMVTKPPNINAKLSPPAAAIVKSLLSKNPITRLGGRNGIEELRSIPYFAAINWDDLYARKIEVPYKPNIQDETDISSFEATFTKEKPVDSIPEPDRRSELDRKKKAGKGGGFLGMLGITSSTPTKPTDDMSNDSDAFKGFSFNKEEVDTVVESPPEGSN